MSSVCETNIHDVKIAPFYKLFFIVVLFLVYRQNPPKSKTPKTKPPRQNPPSQKPPRQNPPIIIILGQNPPRFIYFNLFLDVCFVVYLVLGVSFKP